MGIKNVFVIGAGTMGNGIAQVSAQAGYMVTMSDIKDEFISNGMAAIEKSLDRMVSKGTLQENEKTEIMSKIKTTTDTGEAKDADLVIEAVPEVLELKISIFKQLDEVCEAPPYWPPIPRRFLSAELHLRPNDRKRLSVCIS